VVIDSGCGTGDSTRGLSARFPDALILGVDQSVHRLWRAARLPQPMPEPARARGLLSSALANGSENVAWVPMDLQDFYPRAARAGWNVIFHAVYYPNPWPKPKQLHRRWQGHEVLPDLCAVSRHMELRTNWEIYAREFAAAHSLITGSDGEVRELGPDELSEPISAFERKYRDSGHALWRFIPRPPASARRAEGPSPA
jgi:tRNA G46 methylase TrmB